MQPDSCFVWTWSTLLPRCHGNSESLCIRTASSQCRNPISYFSDVCGSCILSVNTHCPYPRDHAPRVLPTRPLKKWTRRPQILSRTSEVKAECANKLQSRVRISGRMLCLDKGVPIRQMPNNTHTFTHNLVFSVGSKVTGYGLGDRCSILEGQNFLLLRCNVHTGSRVHNFSYF